MCLSVVAVTNWALNDPNCSVAGNDASSGGSLAVNVPRQYQCSVAAY